MERPPPPSPSAPQPKRRKTMVRFTDELDFELIQEAQARNPYGEEHGKKTQAWADVAAAMSVDVDSRRCRERCNQLLDAFEASQKANEKKSGVEESYSLREQHLAELLELREMEALLKSDKKQQKDEQQQAEEDAAAMRDAAMRGMQKGGGKGSQQHLLAYLEERDAKTQALEERKIKIEERKLAQEELRLKLLEQKQEIERAERMAFIEVLKTFATNGLPRN